MRVGPLRTKTPQGVLTPPHDAREQQRREVQDAIEGNQQTKSYKEWAEILKSAAENSLTKVPPNIRESYISEDTWKKIEERDKLEAEQNPENAQKIKDLKKEIRKSTKKDKKQALL